MGGLFGGGGGVAPMTEKAIEETKPKPVEPEAVKANTEETRVAANTRARRRMGTRLLFSQERSAGLGTNQTKLGGASPGENTLA